MGSQPTHIPPASLPPFPSLSLGDVESNAHVAYCFFSSKPSFRIMNFKFQSQTMNLHNTVKQEWYILLLEWYIFNVSFQNYVDP